MDKKEFFSSKYRKKKGTKKKQQIQKIRKKSKTKAKPYLSFLNNIRLINKTTIKLKKKKSISKRISTKEKKTRMFYILGHSSLCYFEDLKKIKYNTEPVDFRIDISKYRNLKVINMQGHGVLNADYIVFIFLKLLNSNKRILDEFKKINNIDSSKKFRKMFEDALEKELTKKVFKEIKSHFDTSIASFNVYPKTDPEVKQNPINVSFTFSDKIMTNMGIFEITDILNDESILDILYSQKIINILKKQKEQNFKVMASKSTSVSEYNKLFFENIEATLMLANPKNDKLIEKALRLPYITINDRMIQPLKCKYINKKCSKNLLVNMKTKTVVCQHHYKIFYNSSKALKFKPVEELNKEEIKKIEFDIYSEENFLKKYTQYQKLVFKFNENISKNIISRLKKQKFISNTYNQGNLKFMGNKKIDKNISQFTLEEIIDLIYKYGDIKDNEEVLLVDFGCKSLKNEFYNIDNSFSFPSHIKLEKQ